ncbi:MAG: hypothetical protein IJU50_09845, partial [Lachnospiraceae bacterium]|nr:hypothetical protein [Lachnospiraceae bacterium]
MDYNRLCWHCMKEVNIGVGYICPCCGASFHVPKRLTHELQPQTILNGKYLVGDILGEGGFGITYIGYDMNIEVRVA